MGLRTHRKPRAIQAPGKGGPFATSCIRNAFDPADQSAQKDDLRLPCGLFLLALESDQLGDVQVDSQPVSLIEADKSP